VDTGQLAVTVLLGLVVLAVLLLLLVVLLRV
jgi:hypothetical protein